MTDPSATSSAIAAPDAGAFKMPQQECPVATYTFSVPGTLPMIGAPSAVTGRWQLCPFAPVSSSLAAGASAGSRISEHNALATFSSRRTASGLTSTRPGSSVTTPGASGYAHTYTSPSGRG